jgi:hypothetical protein
VATEEPSGSVSRFRSTRRRFVTLGTTAGALAKSFVKDGPAVQGLAAPAASTARTRQKYVLFESTSGGEYAFPNVVNGISELMFEQQTFAPDDQKLVELISTS